MQPEFEQDPVEINRYSRCPGCGEIGQTVQTWVEPVDGPPIQMMQCPNNAERCRVEEYRPQTKRREGDE